MKIDKERIYPVKSIKAKTEREALKKYEQMIEKKEIKYHTNSLECIEKQMPSITCPKCKSKMTHWNFGDKNQWICTNKKCEMELEETEEKS